MSILAFPRINFSGELSTNPCTCNNDDVEPAFVQRDSDTFGANVSLTRSNTNSLESALFPAVSVTRS